MMKQHEKVSPYHWVMFLICFFGTAFAGLISTLMSVYLPVAVRDLLGDKDPGQLDQISAYINAVFILGGAVGGFFGGWIIDRSGRKAGVVISIACYGLFTLLNGFMPLWWGVVICRFFSGFGLGAVLVTTTTLMMEVWPSKSRSIFMGILSISIPVGIFSAGLINNLVSSWRQAFLVGIVPLVIAMLGLLFLRESSNWKLHRMQTPSTANETKLLSPVYRADLVRGSLIFGTMLIGLWAIFSWLPTWIQTLVVSGNGQHERGISMMMLGMGGLLGGIVSGWLSNAIGLKRTMVACFTVCAAVSILLFKTSTTAGVAVYAEILVIAVFFGISQGVLSVYIPNLFPVMVRGRATGFCFNIGRFFTAAAVLFVGVLVTHLGGYSSALLVFSSVFIIGLIVTLFAKERDRILEEEFEIKDLDPLIITNN